MCLCCQDNLMITRQVYFPHRVGKPFSVVASNWPIRHACPTCTYSNYCNSIDLKRVDHLKRNLISAFQYNSSKSVLGQVSPILRESAGCTPIKIMVQI